MRVFLAVVFGLVIFAVGFGSVRGLTRPRGGAGAASLPEPQPADPRVRVVWWCETCGAELLVLRRGTEAPFKHCGEPMTRREEVLGPN
ncbi:MAG: hypothetical protein ACRDJM_09690 [Actinomycetota bacterium]